MNIKRLISILVAIVLIAFGVGFFSLKYNDNFKFSKLNSRNIVNLRSNEGTVKIGNRSIEVNDGDSHVSIGWNGINVIDGNDLISIGWDGVKVKDGNKYKFNFFNKNSSFNYDSSDLSSHVINEDKFEDISGVDNISISSTFIDIKVIPEDRDDIRIYYNGRMESNVLPILTTEKISNTVYIKLENPKSNGYTVNNSNAILQVFVPNSFKGDFNISGSSSDIELDKLSAGVFNIKSSSGDIDLEHVEGNILDISSSSGQIYIEDSIGEVNASTNSGDIKIDNKKSNNNMDLSTSSGDIEIKLASDSSYKIKGSSSSGRYSPNIEMNIEENNKGNFKATIGSGENLINISTSSGDVKFSGE